MTLQSAVEADCARDKDADEDDVDTESSEYEVPMAISLDMCETSVIDMERAGLSVCAGSFGDVVSASLANP